MTQHEKIIFYTQISTIQNWCSPLLLGSKCILVAAPRMTQRSFFWLFGNKAPGSFVSWVVGFVIIPIYKELAAGCRIWDVMAVFQESPQEYKIFQGFMISGSNKESKAWIIKCFVFFLVSTIKTVLRVCVTMKVVVRMRKGMCKH